MTEIQTVADVLNVPGFELVSHEPGYTVLKVPSGFTLGIKRLGPYTFQHLDQREDLRDPGPFKITVRVMEKIQPPGVDEIILYRPPTDDDGNVYEPDREEHERGWVYFQRWQMHKQNRSDALVRRDKERHNVSLLNGMDIIDGPISLDDDAWVDRLRTKGFIEPQTPMDRLLLFYKTQIITTIATADIIIFFLRVREVTIEGLKTAFDSFRREMGWATAITSDGQSS